VAQQTRAQESGQTALLVVEVAEVVEVVEEQLGQGQQQVGAGAAQGRAVVHRAVVVVVVVEAAVVVAPHALSAQLCRSSCASYASLLVVEQLGREVLGQQGQCLVVVGVVVGQQRPVEQLKEN